MRKNLSNILTSKHIRIFSEHHTDNLENDSVTHKPMKSSINIKKIPKVIIEKSIDYFSTISSIITAENILNRRTTRATSTKNPAALYQILNLNLKNKRK